MAVVSKIVHNNYVTMLEGKDRTSLSELVTQISDLGEIRLEHETHYDWIAFMPLHESDAGTLTKYVGKVAGEDEYKYRGIECRQRSTSPFIDRAQKALIAELNALARGLPDERELTYEQAYAILNEEEDLNQPAAEDTVERLYNKGHLYEVEEKHRLTDYGSE